MVEVLRDLWGETLALEDTEDLVTSDETDLGNTLAVAELDTDLRGSETLARQLEDLLADVLGGGLQPRRRAAAVRQRRAADTLSLGCKREVVFYN